MSALCWTCEDSDGDLLIRTIGVHWKRWEAEMAKFKLSRELPVKFDGLYARWTAGEVEKLKIVRVVVTRKRG